MPLNVAAYSQTTDSTYPDSLDKAESRYIGSGTENDPYLIYSEEDLRNIGRAEGWSLDCHYKLMRDLTLEKPPSGQSNWSPIGIDKNNPFTGTFDGNGKTISDMTIVNGSPGAIGLFGYIKGENARVENLGIIDVNIEMDSNYLVGAIAGVIYSGTVRNCYATGNIFGGLVTGGLVGNNSGTIESCYSKVDVTGYIWWGCIVFPMKQGLIETDYPYIYKTYESYIGGLVGIMTDGTIKSSYSMGSLKGDYVGGIVGYMVNSKVHNCYTLTNIDGWIFVGGITGYMKTSVIENCYASGDFIKLCFYPYEMNSEIIGVGTGTVKHCVAIFSNVEQAYGSYSQVSDSYMDKLRDTYKDNYKFDNTVSINNEQEITENVLQIPGFLLKSKEELKEQTTYEDLGWNFSGDNPVWEYKGDYMLPKLVGVGGQDDLLTPYHLM